MKKIGSLVLSVFVLGLVGTPAVGAASAEGLKKENPQKKMVFPDASKDPTKPAVGGVRWFWPTHARNYARRQQGNIDLIFLGDSITQGWPGDLFNKYYGSLKGVNFGCGGDQIQHLLMRLEGDDGELRGTTPKVVVLMIGVNNMGDNTAEEIAYGIDNMVKRIKSECPKTRVLLLGILPLRSGTTKKIQAVNRIIAKLDDGKKVRFLDMGAKFVGKDGKGLPGVFSDGVHLTTKGYGTWHRTMNPLLMKMMKQPALTEKDPKPTTKKARKG